MNAQRDTRLLDAYTELRRLRYENRLLAQKLERRDTRIQKLYAELRRKMTGRAA